MPSIRSAFRIIPADAGSTGSISALTLHLTDHPRGCGEHLHACAWHPCSSGSSPRMRGALHVATHADSLSRIIPADAGSTRKTSGSLMPPWDHPRGCGEHSLNGV